MNTTQNVSAQLYFKQLPEDPASGQYGCNQRQGSNILSTCVNDLSTDTNIENAFQDQLNLSEYYKSPGVFEAMKKDYMSQTMEGQNVDSPQEINENKPAPVIYTPQKIPVGPNDFIQNALASGKESFGSNGDNNMLFITGLLILLAIVFYFLISKRK
jgi:hypothetical protein